MRRIIHIILFIILITILTVSSIADTGNTTTTRLPKDYDNQGGLLSGILHNFWHSINPFLKDDENSDMMSNADIYNWYNRTFFGLANWEREVCLMDLSTDVRNVRNIVYDSLTTPTSVYINTVTITSFKQLLCNTTLYETSWYLMPYLDVSNGLKYKVYLSKGSSKEYLVGKEGSGDSTWESAPLYTGASGYDVTYLNKDFNKAVIVYKDSDSSSDDVSEMVVSIVKK